MIERKGDLFSPDNRIIVIPTYGEVRKGALVMNKGIAEMAKNKWPELPKVWGKLIDKYGHHIFSHKTDSGITLLSFPVRCNQYNTPNLKFILDSCEKLVDIVNSNGVKEVYMPRVGCAKGELPWNEIKDQVYSVLDDRFVAITQDAVSELRIEASISKYDKFFSKSGETW
jgi:hypothetical protein